MKRLLVLLLLLACVFPVQGGNNVTQKAVYLQNGTIVIKFINNGADAYWGSHILEYAADALPVLEDLIGVPLPESIKSVEIYGERENQFEKWVVGYNNGNLVALKRHYPNPSHVFHELVHFWTIHYNIPYPLVEGYCELYSHLCAAELGLHEIAYSENYWDQLAAVLADHPGTVILNRFNYMAENATDDQREYFYGKSTLLMHQFYEAVGEENLKQINKKVAESSFDSSRNGIGIIQYLYAAKEITGVNYAEIFMPTLFLEWNTTHVDDFERGISRYYAVSQVIGEYRSEDMNTAVRALIAGKFSEFQITVDTIVEDYYEKLQEEEAELPEQEIIHPERETGLLHNRLFIFGIIMLVVVVALLIYILSKLAKEEEEFEWETPHRGESRPWILPGEEEGESAEELPELPDLERLTK